MTLRITPWEVMGLPEIDIGDHIEFKHNLNEYWKYTGEIVAMYNDAHMICIMQDHNKTLTGCSYHYVTKLLEKGNRT